jgi:hypothetical protein
MKDDKTDSIYPLTCDDCGTTEGVLVTLCPFANEILHKEEYVELCSKCYHIRAEEV